MNLKYLFLAATCSFLTFTSCSDDEENDIPTVCPGTDVPENVLNSFNKIYGNVQDVKWQYVNNYHVAHFNGSPLTKADSYTTSAWFTNEGKHCQVDQDIHFNQLPAAVKAGLDAYMKSFYPDWIAEDCEVVMREGMGLIYVIEIEKGEQERELSFSENGDFLKDVLDNDGADFITPVVVPNEVQTALAKLFPESKNLSILEIEVDDNEIEVDILDGNRHKEVTFSSNYTWISTEYEVTMAEAQTLIDPAVMQKLVAMAAAAGIDITNPLVQQGIEINVVENVLQGLYFEVEIESGNFELEVIIDKNGNIVKIDN